MKNINLQNNLEKLDKNRKVIDKETSKKLLAIFANNIEKVKEFIKQELLLSNQDIIIFAKGKFFIIHGKQGERRFQGLKEEDLDLFIKTLLKNYNIKKYLLGEIDKVNYQEIKNSILNNTYKQYLLYLTANLVKKIINSEIDEKLILAIAGKILRENFIDVIKKIVKLILEKEDLTEKLNNYLIQNLQNLMGFKNKTDYFQVNFKLSEIIKLLIKNYLENIGIRDNLVQNQILETIYPQLNQSIFHLIVENIFQIAEKNQPDIEKNILKFLEYYYGGEKIINNKKVILPNLEINSYPINGSSNPKIIYLKLKNFLQQIKQLKIEIENIKKRLSNVSFNPQSIKEEYHKTIQEFTKEIENIDKQIEELRKNLKKLNQESKTTKLLSLITNEKNKLLKEIDKLESQKRKLNLQKREIERKLVNIKSKEKIEQDKQEEITHLQNILKEKENKLESFQNNLTYLKKELIQKLSQRHKLLN